MTVDWTQIFDAWGIKTVSPTDKRKLAYVPNKAQVSALRAAGKTASPGGPGAAFDITVLFSERPSVVASFYHSIRKKPGRNPEPRIGREFISEWLKQGDRVLIGAIGGQLYALVQDDSNRAVVDVAASVVARAETATASRILARAKRAAGKPKRRTVKRDEFVRNPNVVAGALVRADGRCEFPSCSRGLFLRDDTKPYLEVHHVIPLAEGGDDTLANAAALCPSCHRELHLGSERTRLRKELSAQIAKVTI